MTEYLKLVVLIVLAALVTAVLIATPLAMIWSLNTLFSLGIEYTTWTWLAALFVIMVIGHRGYKS